MAKDTGKTPSITVNWTVRSELGSATENNYQETKSQFMRATVMTVDSGTERRLLENVQRLYRKATAQALALPGIERIDSKIDIGLNLIIE